MSRNLPPELAGRVQPYRSGYLAEERRQVEADLANGRVRAVIATSALELGVDIGGLDATVLCGFPGTIASFWQQIGRAGRNGTESVSILVAGDDQLDQWFIHHPRDLFERPPEPAVINVSNPWVLDPHLACAAFELPVSPSDERWWDDLDEGIRRGVQADRLRIRRPTAAHRPRAVWAGRGLPSSGIGLRAAAGGEVKIVDVNRSTIGTVEAGRAAHLVHPGAIYLHRGQAWKVVELDLMARQVVVIEDTGDTWTQVRQEVTIEVLDTGKSRPVGRARLHRGQVQVTTRVIGYGVHAHGSDVTIDYPLDLPPQELVTTAVWYEWDPGTVAAAGIREFQLPGALHAAEHAAIGILPLFTICDRWDVGGVSTATAPESGVPTVFIHDAYPGGAGIADLAFDAADRHLAATLDVLEACACATGCPSCVQSPKCGNGNEPLDKVAAAALLATTLGGVEPF